MSEKIPEGWKRVKLGEVTVFNYGKSLPEKKRIRGDIPVYSSAGITGWHNEALVNSKGIIVGRKGTIGKVYKSKIPFYPIDTCYYILPDKNYDFDFIYYSLVNLKLDELNEDSAVPGLNRNTAYSQEILLPPLPEQKAIASVLSSLDDKIDLLNRQNQTLEKIAETLFRKWFIEDAKDDWEEVKLGDFFPIITGKKNANFATDNGKYPFFTCSQKFLKASSYSFEGHAILLAGNGDFNVKRYNGKFEAYQRTYVLIPYNEEYVGLLYTLIKYFLLDITGSHKGSVINFITKEMIENFSFKLPKNREEDENFKEKLANLNLIYKKVDFNLNQIQTLENLRDTLLPKLMSGEVRVKGEV